MRLNVDEIGVAGDWHGDTLWAMHALDLFAERGIKYIVQLGDFGIWPGPSGAKYILKIQKTLQKNGQRLGVVPGNHDDYARINNTQFGLDGLQYFRKEIILIPRGFRMEIGGRSVVALGGANSIDYEGRTEGINWWREESITLGDVYRTVSGGEADIMFTHDVPYGVTLPENHRDPDSGWSPEAIMYADDSRMMMRGAVDGVKPKLFMHGHYHTFYDSVQTLNDGLVDYETRFIGLGKNGGTNNNAILNLNSLEIVDTF